LGLGGFEFLLLTQELGVGLLLLPVIVPQEQTQAHDDSQSGQRADQQQQLLPVLLPAQLRVARQQPNLRLLLIQLVVVLERGRAAAQVLTAEAILVGGE
jgi:hypothetical protein